jgi:hypothetical protein
MVLRHRTEITLLGIVVGSIIAWASPGDRLEILIGIGLFALLIGVIPSRRAIEGGSSEGGWYSSYFWSRELTPAWFRAIALLLELALVIGLIVVWIIVF